MIRAPGAPVRYVIALCILTVFGTISFSIYKNRAHTHSNKVAEQSVSEENLFGINLDTAQATDLDGDGLMDWEEGLWGTSAVNSDSDNDGTPDGEEVTQNRNPIVSGDDAIATTTDSGNYVPQETDPNSLTSKIARSIFENVTEVSGVDAYSPEVGAQIAAQIAQAAANAAAPQIVFNIGDVKIMNQPSKADIKNYGNDLMRHILENMRDVYLDPASYDDLGVSARGFRSIAEDLAEMEVPAQIAGTHSKVVNNYYNIYEALEYVYYYKKDPAQALLALRTYSDIAQEQPRQFMVIEDYLKSNGIIYNADEPGAVAFPSLIGFEATNENL